MIPDILAALAIATWAQDVWQWRPWVSITGPSNCGKTTLFRFLNDYFGPNLSMLVGDTTAAGLRQSIDINSKIILLDEFESNHERPKIIQWLKNAGAGGSAVRGTPGQAVVKSKVKVIPWMASIEAQMNEESERNRYISIHMNSRAGKGFFKYPSPEEIADLRAKSLAVICRVYPRVMEIHSSLIGNFKTDLATRYVESWGLPVAMYSAIMNFSDQEALEMMNAVMEFATDDLKETAETEDQSLLQSISGAHVSIGGGAYMTVAELLASPSYGVGKSSEAPSKHLARVGVKRLPDDALNDKKPIKDEPYVFLCHKTVAQTLLKNTKYQGVGIDQILMRCEGAIRQPADLMGKTFRGVNIPLKLLISIKSDEKDSFIPDGEAE